ncbi:MAG TPA: DUF4838 domain-containing protein [Gemmataceae bacterium]|nr:DUF4838 domain-containing protein [Gemmataceae bacterium]
MKHWNTSISYLAGCLVVGLSTAAPSSLHAEGTGKPATAVVLVKDGVPLLPIVAGSVKEPVQELQHYLAAMTGARPSVKAAARDATPGIYVGLAADFPRLRLEGVEQLGPEGFLIRSDGKSLFLIAREARGVEHAVSAFLHSLGCRWFFPGKTWEVVPRQKTVTGSWDERQTPSFTLQRKIWYGFGASPQCARDLAEWERHNRMGGPVRITIGHTWHGLNPAVDFKSHPEWFAEVGGKRQPSKPCYSHPGVVQRATEYALGQAAKGVPMISMTPPDGLGFCECERCRAVCQGGKPYKDLGTTFARRPDGVLVSVTSETLFQFINQVAAAVAAKYPKTLVGCYAYSAYSHPPSFKLHPNVFLQTTTAFRRTPLSLAEQLDAFRKIEVQSGVRAYHSVYQWDWDYPTIAKGELSLPRLVNDLRFYQKQHVQSVNAEASCNWGPRGLGYYLAARLLWDVREDPRALIADFYDKAFGPAALPMERYYVRWLGSYVAVRTKAAAVKPGVEKKGADKILDELGATDLTPPEGFNRATLRAAYRDLDEAAGLVKDLPEYRARVDHLRLYAHYLSLRIRLEEAAKTKDREKVRAAVQDEAVFGARLMNTNLIHSRPLIGKEFYRRFLPYRQYLEGTTEWPESTREAVGKAAGKGYRRPRTDVPDAEELNRLWREDKKALGIP